MPIFLFTRHAEKAFRKLDAGVQRRIFDKLTELKGERDERSIAKMHAALPATHRLRIGEYRLILARREDGSFLVLDAGHRSTIYR